MANKHIVVEEDYKTQIGRQAKEHGMTEKDFVQSMSNFFEKTGIDPTKTSKETINSHLKRIEKLIKNTDSRIISFIKQQEKTHLSQIIERLEIIVKSQQDYVENFKDIADSIDNFDENYMELIKQINTNQKTLNENMKLIVQKL